MIGHRKAVVEQVSTPWMLTFADLLALLLTFFVLLFSMNRIQFEDWRSVVDTMTGQFNPERAAVEIEESTSRVIVQKPKKKALNLNYLRSLFADTVRRTPALAGVELYQEGSRLVVAIPGGMVFDGGTATLVPGAEQRIATLANILAVIRNELIVSGHARQTEVIKSDSYDDAWQLGLARSRIVANMLADNGYLETIRTTSYGDTRGDDISNELSVLQREYWANRIDITIIEQRRDDGAFDL